MQRMLLSKTLQNTLRKQQQHKSSSMKLENDLGSLRNVKQSESESNDSEMKPTHFYN